MTEEERRALEDQFGAVYDLINEMLVAASRLQNRVEEARQALGLPPKDDKEGTP